MVGDFIEIIFCAKNVPGLVIMATDYILGRTSWLELCYQ